MAAREAHGVAVTGMGAVTPLGVGVPAYVAALREGRSGVRPLPFRAPAGHPIKSTVAACVPREVFEPTSVMDEAETARLPRLVPMALAAAREAVESAGADAVIESVDGARRVGLVLGTGAGGIDFTSDQAASVHGGGRPSLWTITNATHGNLAGELSIRLGLRGPSWCVSTGCASASDAVGLGLQWLRDPRGTLDAVVVVGADAHVRWETLLGMELLRVISTRDLTAAGEDPASASRPFDRSRDGFVLGEGAWAAVLEREEVARARGARVVGEVLGYGATCDAYHRVRPAPDMEESARAVRLAIEDAALTPPDVELVHYHGTATRLNDAGETAAVKLAFGREHARRLRGTSVKGAIGHPQGACGLASLVATLGCLEGPAPFVPPTAHLREPDAAGGCDLEYTPLHPFGVERRARGHVALINCLAFGAKNSALVVRGGAATR